MYKLDLITRQDRIATLSQGSTFCSIGTVLTFEIQDAANKYAPIEINFSIEIDEKQEKFSTDKGEFIDRRISVRYFNPSTGASGPIKPISILKNDKHIVNLFFQVDKMKNSEMCKLSYEFFLTNKK